MIGSIKTDILQTYPPILSLENVRVILRISKRKAAWMLHNGYIKCLIKEQKTRSYEVKIEDLLEYIDKVKKADPSVNIPSGLFSSRKCKEHRSNPSVVAPSMIHQIPPSDFRDWLNDVWLDVGDALAIKDVPKLIGYTEKTIQEWATKKTLKTAWSQNRLFTTKEWIIDFLMVAAYKIKYKSPIHTQLLLQYYAGKDENSECHINQIGK